MPARTRVTLDVQENRLERLAAEYRATIEAGGWPRCERHPDGGVIAAPWAPRREAPFVTVTDADGWVDQNNNCLVVPAEDPEHAGMWRANTRHNYEWQGEQVRCWYGRDAAECMAWADIVRENENYRWEQRREAERTQGEPGFIWAPFNGRWHNTHPGWLMPERLRLESCASAEATWRAVYEQWLEENPGETPNWLALREVAHARWRPEFERFMEMEVSQEELEEERRLWREAEQRGGEELS